MRAARCTPSPTYRSSPTVGSPVCKLMRTRTAAPSDHSCSASACWAATVRASWSGRFFAHSAAAEGCVFEHPRKHVYKSLPPKEVLHAVRSLRSSQTAWRPATLGTHLGDRLRDARAMYVRPRGNKKAICWPFKSPLTDSNRRPPPYHGGFGCGRGSEQQRLLPRFACGRAVSLAGAPLPRRALSIP